MAKFHVKANGDMGPCRAQEGGRPFSAEGAEHFDSFANAAVYAEAVIAREEGGSFAQGGLSKPAEAPSLNADEYTLTWDESKYLGQYIEEGGYFAKDGDVYQAHDWEWNRALLSTKVNATNMSTGEEETLTIWQGSEPQVSFIDHKNTVKLPNGERVAITTLNDYEGDPEVAETMATAFAEGKVRDHQAVETPSGLNYYVDEREITVGESKIYALRTGEIPLEEEDDSRQFMWSTRFFADASEASEAFDRAVTSAQYWR